MLCQPSRRRQRQFLQINTPLSLPLSTRMYYTTTVFYSDPSATPRE
jgi:hypothetical protein